MPGGSHAPELPNEDISGFGWSDFLNSLRNRRWTLAMAMVTVLVGVFAWMRTPLDRPPDAYAVLYLVGGAVVGFGAGIALALMLERRDDVIRSELDVEEYREITLLGVVPEAERIVSRRQAGDDHSLVPVQNEDRLEFHSHYRPASPVSAAYRRVRKSLLLMSAGGGHRVFLVTSPSPSEGKTTTSVNMAIALAQTGTPTLLVSTDFRRPRTDEVFYARARGGLSGVLFGRVSLAETVVATHVPNLSLLPCGRMPKDPVGMLASDGFRDLVTKLRAGYGYVVFDSPPISKVPEALALAREVDATILVVRARRSSRRLTRLVLDRLSQTGTSCPVGMVLSGRGGGPAGSVALEGSPSGRAAASSRL
jgi:polysaccharide biosynthesis transport protein